MSDFRWNLNAPPAPKKEGVAVNSMRIGTFYTNERPSPNIKNINLYLKISDTHSFSIALGMTFIHYGTEKHFVVVPDGPLNFKFE
jgi:hypothetical protein